MDWVFLLEEEMSLWPFGGGGLSYLEAVGAK